MPDAITLLNTALEGRYRIERLLGEGGMATVYLADDLRHERKVALKVPQDRISELVGAERFLTEIRTTAKLHHPHVLSLYDSGEAKGLLYYVMPFVEGETLRQRLKRAERLPVEEAIRLISEAAEALSYAHGHGVVHRDIKPENIMISNGHALVSDFGLAVTSTAASGEGDESISGVTGTAAYMSPEQAAGERNIDHRSDIYSLGCVLYEALTGAPPFTGKSAREVVAQRFSSPPPSARKLRPRVSHRTDAAIRTAMALEPRDRFQSAARFADAISSKPINVNQTSATNRSIAVLPFKNMSADPDAEFLSDGITEDILNSLVRLPGLRVIARTSSFAFKGRDVDVREIGEQLGVGNVLEGSVRKAGNRIRLTAQLVDASGGYQIWSERYDREMEDVFAIQDEISEAIRDALSEKLLGLGRADLSRASSIDPETYELFLRGRFFVAKRVEGMQRGMELLAEVVARAPKYAPAYAELATAYNLLTHYYVVPPRMGWPKVEELAQAALQIDPSLARAHAEVGNVALWSHWDWTQSREHYERALTIDPNDPWVDAVFSTYLASLMQYDEAIQQCRRAQSLDPLNPNVSAALATVEYLARRFEDAIATCDRLLDQESTYSDAYRLKGAALRELGRFEEALGPTEAAILYSGSHPWMVSLMGMLHAAAGRVGEARAVISELEDRHRRSTEPPYVPPLAAALIYAQLDDADSFFMQMDRSYAARDSWLIMLRADPSFDKVRADRRFANLVERVGIPRSSE